MTTEQAATTAPFPTVTPDIMVEFAQPYVILDTHVAVALRMPFMPVASGHVSVMAENGYVVTQSDQSYLREKPMFHQQMSSICQ